MKKDLYELLDGTDAAQLEPLISEAAVPLPEGVSLERIKSQVRQNTGLGKKSPFRWQHIAALAACVCLVMASLWAAGLWRSPPAPGREELPPVSGEGSEPIADGSEPIADGSALPDINGLPDYGTVGEAPEPDPSISLRSLEDLAMMRAMALSEDAEALEEYLKSVEGGGAHSREDLVDFLALVDSLPVLPLPGSRVTWIHHQSGYTVDTGAYYNTAFLTMEAEGDESLLMQYRFDVTDIPAVIEELKEAGAFTGSTLEAPLQAQGGRITVYGESREPDACGTGDMITWFAEIDGIFTQIRYRTADADAISTADVFADIPIVRISDLENGKE